MLRFAAFFAAALVCAAQIEKQAEGIRHKMQCKKYLIDGAEAQRFTTEQVVAAFGGKITNEIVEAKSCDVARSLGF